MRKRKEKRYKVCEWISVLWGAGMLASLLLLVLAKCCYPIHPLPAPVVQALLWSLRICSAATVLAQGLRLFVLRPRREQEKQLPLQKL